MKQPNRHQSRFAVITGANSDLGLPIVETLLDAGYTVFGHFYSNPQAFEKFGTRQFQAIQADLTRPNEAKALFEKISETTKEIHALLNLVGPFDPKPLSELTPESWNRTIELNLNTVFNSIHFARPFLKSRSHIVNFTYAGVENIRALPEATPYAAAKAGVAVVTKSFAAELAKSGVRVNAIAPGWIDNIKFTPEEREVITGKIPLGRLGEAEEVARVVAWLLDDSPLYMTGATLSVSGGWEF